MGRDLFEFWQVNDTSETAQDRDRVSLQCKTIIYGQLNGTNVLNVSDFD